MEILVIEPPQQTDLAAVDAFHNIKLTLSLDIIECHQLLIADERLKTWHWVYQNAQQWHATIYVLEELARRPDAPCATRAWQLIGVIFSDIELLNKHGMKLEHRTRLLEVHGHALRAREAILKPISSSASATAITEQSWGPPLVPQQPIPSADLDSSTKSEPWQFDQSLFDIQEAQLNSNAFFWPSVI